MGQQMHTIGAIDLAPGGNYHTIQQPNNGRGKLLKQGGRPIGNGGDHTSKRSGTTGGTSSQANQSAPMGFSNQNVYTAGSGLGIQPQSNEERSTSGMVIPRSINMNNRSLHRGKAPHGAKQNIEIRSNSNNPRTNPSSGSQKNFHLATVDHTRTQA